MIRTPFGRRHMLRALGLGGLAATLPSLMARRAHADPPAIPRRVLFVYNMETFAPFWSPVGASGAPAPTETSFALGELHQSLVPHQKRLIYLEGLDMVSTSVDPTGGANGHVAGGTHALTAIDRFNPTLAGGVSIDQYIAQQINSPTPLTRFPSVEMSGGNGTDAEGGTSYLAAGQQVSPENDPMKVYGRLFSPEILQGKQAAAALVAQRKSVLDFARGEFTAADTRLSHADRLRLDAHASAMSDLESRLSLVAAAACQPPDSSFPTQVGVKSSIDLMSRLVTSAFSCDLLRVATLHLPNYDELAGLIGFTKDSGSDSIHGLAHDTNPGGALTGNPAAMAMFKKYHIAQTEMVASLLDSLAGIPEGDGTSLLDHTMVVWTGQLGNGGHDLRHLNWLMTDGGAFKGGRYLKYERDDKDRGQPHNNLFVSLAQAMGVTTNTFGNPAVCTGPIANL